MAIFGAVDEYFWVMAEQIEAHPEYTLLEWLQELEAWLEEGLNEEDFKVRILFILKLFGRRKTLWEVAAHKGGLTLLSAYVVWICAGGLLPSEKLTEQERLALLRMLVRPLQQTMQELLLDQLQETFYVERVSDMVIETCLWSELLFGYLYRPAYHDSLFLHACGSVIHNATIMELTAPYVPSPDSLEAADARSLVLGLRDFAHETGFEPNEYSLVTQAWLLKYLGSWVDTVPDAAELVGEFEEQE